MVQSRQRRDRQARPGEQEDMMKLRTWLTLAAASALLGLPTIAALS